MRLSDQDKQKASNIKGLFQNSQTRTMIIITGVVVVGLLGVGILKTGKTADEVVASKANVNQKTNVEHQPGVNSSPAHAILQNEANARAIEEAKNSNASSLPVLTSNQDVDQNIELPTVEDPSRPVQNVLPTVQFAPVQQEEAPQSQQQLPDYNNYGQQTPPPAEVPEHKLKQIYAWMGQFSRQPNLGFQEYVVVAGSAKKWEAPELDQNMIKSMQQSMAAQSTAEKSKIRFVRQGSMVPAKLVTPLNSKEPGPVLAEITSGPLAGARLLGTASQGDKSLLVNFSSITKPGWPSSYPIQAVAMNIENSTALASDVNNHYIKKYGGMLGGAFISGYGEGMKEQGGISVVDPSGTIIEQNNPLDSSQILKKAKGETLQTIGRNIERDSQGIRPTIKVEGKDGAPYPIQILFLKDF